MMLAVWAGLCVTVVESAGYEELSLESIMTTDPVREPVQLQPPRRCGRSESCACLVSTELGALHDPSSQWAQCMTHREKGFFMRGMFSRGVDYLSAHARPPLHFERLITSSEDVLEIGTGDGTALLGLLAMREALAAKTHNRSLAAMPSVRCAIGMNHMDYNIQYVGWSNLAALGRSSLFPHLTVAGGHGSRDAFEAGESLRARSHSTQQREGVADTP